MKTIDTKPRIIQINEILQWQERKELILSPKYQRNRVWNDKAKSYLIDSILRGFPIPPIFLRQRIDVNTRTTEREIIDGQQRLRAILEYVNDNKIVIQKSMNPRYAGKRYCDLEIEEKERILSYEIIAITIAENDDSIIYDMFARLNSNNVVLNRQEIRNAKFWGEFKILVYDKASKYRDFFIEERIFKDKDLSRMKDAEYISSLFILMSEGIVDETPTYVDKFYDRNDSCFENQEKYTIRFDQIILEVCEYYKYINSEDTRFTNKNYLFTLFAVIYHQMFGLVGFGGKRIEIFASDKIAENRMAVYNQINELTNILDELQEEKTDIENKEVYMKFMKLHQARTTNKIERNDRINFLNEYLVR